MDVFSYLAAYLSLVLGLAVARVLINPFLLYVLAALMCPRITPEKTVDLESSFYRNRVWFFPILAVIVVTEYVDSLLRTGFSKLGWEFTVFMGAAVAVTLSGAIVKNKTYHAALFIVVLVMWAFVWYLFGADIRYSRS